MPDSEPSYRETENLPERGADSRGEATINESSSNNNTVNNCNGNGSTTEWPRAADNEEAHTHQQLGGGLAARQEENFEVRRGTAVIGQQQPNQEQQRFSDSTTSQQGEREAEGEPETGREEIQERHERQDYGTPSEYSEEEDDLWEDVRSSEDEASAYTGVATVITKRMKRIKRTRSMTPLFLTTRFFCLYLPVPWFIHRACFLTLMCPSLYSGFPECPCGCPFLLSAGICSEVDRHAVEEVVCATCGVRQPVGNTCINCSSVFGAYFCHICLSLRRMRNLPFGGQGIVFSLPNMRQLLPLTIAKQAQMPRERNEATVPSLS
ncbi:zinc finger (chy type) domain-containing protein [Cyclospora cayetanensis]|uniref:Zinc finger (Chy type) domain-containing protein n=1 Tax=Cyclospora cayetanensis TaxID=88456 RepID=A0A1D3CV36_9EIME|nr:zinc finger (chy type) domain-containing protein [Cyclospora cayetanensis]